MTDTMNPDTKRKKPVRLPSDLIDQLAIAYKHVRSDKLVSLKFPEPKRAQIAYDTLVGLLGADKGIQKIEATHVFTDVTEQQVLVPMEQLRRLDEILNTSRVLAPGQKVDGASSKLAGRLHVTGEFLDVPPGTTFH